MQDVESTVFSIIAQKAGDHTIVMARDTDLASLNLDSIDKVEIIFEIEEAFDISLVYNANRANTAEGAGIVTVGDVIDLVKAQVETNNAPPVH
jgi:acyl carrier protein